MPAIGCWVLAAVPHNSTPSLTGRSSGAQGETLCWNSLVTCWFSHISLQGSGQSRTTHVAVCPVRPQFTPLFLLALGIPFTRYLSWHEKFYGWTWYTGAKPVLCQAQGGEPPHRSCTQQPWSLPGLAVSVQSQKHLYPLIPTWVSVRPPLSFPSLWGFSERQQP